MRPKRSDGPLRAYCLSLDIVLVMVITTLPPFFVQGFDRVGVDPLYGWQRG
jgi:hypothetical protein